MLALILTALFVASVSSVELGTRQAPTKGDKFCAPSVCVSATVNEASSTVEYVVSSTGRYKKIGWIGIGFGYGMVNTPMVITWANPDGSMTLSQRQAEMHVMPTVVAEPPRLATAQPSLSQLSGSKVQFAFSVPLDGNTGVQNHIFALSSRQPSSASVDAEIIEHDDYGYFKLDLSKDLAPSTTTHTPSTPSTQQTAPTQSVTKPGPKKATEHVPSTDMPYTSYQRLIIAHAVFASVGFLILLPLGALAARYLRTFTPMWFKVHWVVQVALAGPCIIIGAGLGIYAVNITGGLHLSDEHKRWGIGLFALYLSQVIFGVVTHFSKSDQRSLRNYLHVIFGISIIAISFKQVWNGYNVEWRYATGRSPLPSSVNNVFWTWLGVVVFCYVAGLGLLGRQLKQERLGVSKEAVDADEVRLETRAVRF